MNKAGRGAQAKNELLGPQPLNHRPHLSHSRKSGAVPAFGETTDWSEFNWIRDQDFIFLYVENSDSEMAISVDEVYAAAQGE